MEQPAPHTDKSLQPLWLCAVVYLPALVLALMFYAAHVPGSAGSSIGVSVRAGMGGYAAFVVAGMVCLYAGLRWFRAQGRVSDPSTMQPRLSSIGPMALLLVGTVPAIPLLPVPYWQAHDVVAVVSQKAAAADAAQAHKECEESAVSIGLVPEESKTFHYAIAVRLASGETKQVTSERNCLVELWQRTCKSNEQFKKERDGGGGLPLFFRISGGTIERSVTVEPPNCTRLAAIASAQLEAWKKRHPKGNEKQALSDWKKRVYADSEFADGFRFSVDATPSDLSKPEAIDTYGFQWIGFKVEATD